MNEEFIVTYFIILAISGGLLSYVTWKWRKDKNSFRYKLNKITEKLEVTKIQLRGKHQEIEKFKHLLSQKPLIGHVESEPPEYEGRWQDPDHPILTRWEDQNHPILR